MAISIFDLFSVGVGPSSSHTNGPMSAGLQFVKALEQQGGLASCQRIQIHLYGSLALTGKGHGTDWAVLMGLEGHCPSQINCEAIQPRFKAIQKEAQLTLNALKSIPFHYQTDLIFHYDKTLEYHVNALRIVALDSHQHVVFNDTYYSIGGGFILSEQDVPSMSLKQDSKENVLPWDFTSGEHVLRLCQHHHKSIAQLVFENERTWRSESEINEQLDLIWQVMKASIERGLNAQGVLPGGLNVKRRAKQIYEKLNKLTPNGDEPSKIPWLNVFALAVNEENAAGRKVVTAPTNGAAGIIPSVLNYHLTFNPKADPLDYRPFLLTAGGLGILFKQQGSISGAEVGCQGEVGVACSMAAGGLAAILGGSVLQVENAAEIGMEHHLGLTCDPINGLVQIPCIERNAVAAVKAYNAAQLALLEDGCHKVSLDKVIKTMMRTGKDMLSIYKETSKGGLAVNHPEC